ncbi:FAD-dependent monooxygenase, partial [Nitratireductor sp. GCM10026969]|uniref:FAD-dependent monooxygenase n=1 Tax=Nitratireductor sp. GCM10026969 TaxID=3252645 RepID=UPI003612C674
MSDRAVTVAGAGIAGLTAALSFAAKGFSVTVFEKAAHLDEVGAGLQLSPNATRVLDRLGVLDRLSGNAVEPRGIVLRDAASLASLACIPLDAAEKRWGAPYLVAHRADLQRVLLERVRERENITLETGVAVRGATFGKTGVTVELDGSPGERRLAAGLLVAADGVWSALRPLANANRSRFTGHIAFRAVVSRRSAGLDHLTQPDTVTAFLAPDFHVVAYPLRGGEEINLVAVTKGGEIRPDWSNDADTAHLARATSRAAPALSHLIGRTQAWTAWPIHAVEGDGPWTHPGGLALIGDAAHALTPHAAQGAAMAIEDAALLAELAAHASDTETLLGTFERLRRP